MSDEWKPTLRIWLDDERTPPGKSWVWLKTPDEVISRLRFAIDSGKRPDNIEVSLDHDLGDDVSIGTGYDVLVWIEQHVSEGNACPAQLIHLHTANPVGRARMAACLASIWKMEAAR